MLQIISIYFTIGVVCSFCFDVLMDWTEAEQPTTFFERVMWITLWPVFVLIFITGMRK